MAKNIAIGILGGLVLILSILGIVKYKEKNSIDIGLGIGNHGIGSGRYKNTGGIDFGGGDKSKTKKGNFIKCIAYEDSLKAVGYFEFKNGNLHNMIQYETSGEVPADYMQKHTKKDVENELLGMVCTIENKPACGNVKFSWSGRKVTMTLGVDINVITSSLFKTGISESEFLSSMSKDKGTTCEKVSKAPIYATKADPAGTYSGTSGYNDTLTSAKQKAELDDVEPSTTK